MVKFLESLHINIGFSWKGLIIILLPMLPNILFFVLEDPNKAVTLTNSHLLLDIIEQGSRFLFIALIICLVSKKESPIISSYTLFIALLLLIYIGSWILYFTIGVNSIILMLMAIVPVLYYILSEIWLNNYIAIIPTVIFGVAHTIITYVDYVK